VRDASAKHRDRCDGDIGIRVVAGSAGNLSGASLFTAFERSQRRLSSAGRGVRGNERCEPLVGAAADDSEAGDGGLPGAASFTQVDNQLFDIAGR
jgi:hypothetical protein